MTAVRTRTQAPPLRRRRRPRDHDAFHIPREAIPKGQDWQWNRISTLGEPDRENQIDAREAGWAPIRWKDLPESMRPIDLTEAGLNDPVVRRGQMLMGRDLDLTMEARAEDLQAARNQISTKQRQLGQAGEGLAPRPLAQVDRTYERPQRPAQQTGVAEGQDVE